MKRHGACLFLLITFCWMAQAIADDTAATAPAAHSLEATTYQIRNQKYQELLRPKDANNADGTRIVLYSPEPWKCMTWRLQTATNDGYCLRNVFTAKTFSFAADGTARPVTQIPYSHQPDKNPVWQFTKLEDGTYKISDAKNDGVLTAVPNAGGDGESIVVQPWQNLDEQKWELSKIDPKDLTM